MLYGEILQQKHNHEHKQVEAFTFCLKSCLKQLFLDKSSARFNSKEIL
jgi:hypothetical protein